MFFALLVNINLTKCVKLVILHTLHNSHFVKFVIFMCLQVFVTLLEFSLTNFTLCTIHTLYISHFVQKMSLFDHQHESFCNHACWKLHIFVTFHPTAGIQLIKIVMFVIFVCMQSLWFLSNSNFSC